MALILDAPKAEYIVVTYYTEYEQTVSFFVGEQAARDYFANQLAMGTSGTEVYISKILA